MTDTERETLCARIDELCAENERLRVANAAFTGRSIRAGDKMACLEAENAKLRELVKGLRYCANEAYGMCARVPVGGDRPFTCCPVYDFDAKEYGCEKLMRELGIEVGE